MKTVASTLLHVVNHSDPNGTDYQIARYLLEHPRRLRHNSLIEMASDAMVSVSTLNRFCRNIGYQNYSTLRDIARLDEKMMDVTTNEEERAATPDELRQMFFENAEAIDALDTTLLRRAAELVMYSKSVYVVGYGVALFPTLWLQSELLELGRLIEVCFSDPSQVVRIDAGEHDLLIIVSVTGGYLGYFGDEVARKRCRKLLIGSPGHHDASCFEQIVPCGVHTNIPLRKYALMQLYDRLFDACEELGLPRSG